MSAPLIVTKFHRPKPRVDWIPRTHLMGRLDEGLSSRLILVSAPAGFGKSSLITSWINQIDVPVTWLAIDELDNDANKFLLYVVAAIRVIHPGFGKSYVSAMEAPQPPAVSSILNYFINDLVDVGDMVLVLDDYHLIKNEVIHTFIDSLIRYAPETFHLVLSTRSDPPIQLTHLRAKGLMVEVRTNELRFSSADICRLTESRFGITLNDDLIAVLNQRTEGWITGLQMALLSLQHVDDKESYIHQFSSSNRYVLDYLVEEVLSLQTDDLRRFLLMTACLPKLCASLCAAVSGYQSTQEILEGLEKENLFTIALDDQRQWYRYHHLFSDLLQQQALSTKNIDIAFIYLKASNWYEQNQELNLAVDFALRAGSYARAIEVLDRPGMYALTDFGLLALEKHLDQIPYELVKEHPNLLMSYAWIYLATSQPERVEKYLADIENYYGVQAEKVEMNKSQSSAVRCLLAELQIVRGNVCIHQSDFDTVLTLCSQAEQYLDEEAREFSLTQYEILWSLLHYNFALAYEYLGELRLAEMNFQECILLSKKYHNAHLIPVGTSHLAQVQKAKGNLQGALETYLEAIKYMEESEVPTSPLAGIAYAGIGHLYYQFNLLNEAEQAFMKGLELAKLWNHWESINSANFGLACVFTAVEKWDKVEKQLKPLLDSVNEIDSPWGKQRILAQAAQFSIQRKDVKNILNWVEHFKPLLSEDIIFTHVYELLVYARAQIEIHNYDESEALINSLCKYCEEKEWVEYRIQCLIILSILKGRQGQMGESGEYMKSALLLGQIAGYKRILIDEFGEIETFLVSLKNDELVGNYVQILLFESKQLKLKNKHQTESAFGPEPLSNREVEVLAKIAEGLTNQQAALALHIAEGTIKNHLKNIFGKLQAANRTQAILIAREKGYLE